jgi:hypothetical protein
MSRSNIKKFESFKNSNTDKYVEDIEGILVELKDKGFELGIEPTYFGGFSIRIYKWWSNPIYNGEDYDTFKLTDVYEYLLTLETYFKIYFKEKKVYYNVRKPSKVGTLTVYDLHSTKVVDVKSIEMILY